MSLTSSGEIHLSASIGGELGESGVFQNSLTEASDGTVATINTGNASGDRPDGSAPHAMSEFYSYDHDLVTNATFNAWTGSFSGNDIIFSVTVGGSSQTKTGYGIFVTGSSGALLVGKQKVSGDTMDTTVQINISTDNFSLSKFISLVFLLFFFDKTTVISPFTLVFKPSKLSRL